MNAETAGRFTEDRHVVGISAKGADVALHPAKCRLLVHQAVVARRPARGLGRKCRMSEEAELAQPVVDGDDDDTSRHQRAGVVCVALADHEAAAVDPEHHGKQVPRTM
jgi:hypothetical protein